MPVVLRLLSIAPLDILLKRNYLHLECLVKKTAERIELLQGTLDLLNLDLTVANHCPTVVIQSGVQVGNSD